jgi:hypothetical protein
MLLELLETGRHWRATVDYHGSRGRQTVYLMDDGLIGGGYHWLIADYLGQWPRTSCAWDAQATARMIQIGKMRLIRGQWPEVILGLLAQPPSSTSSDQISRGSLNGECRR